MESLARSLAPITVAAFIVIMFRCGLNGITVNAVGRYAWWRQVIRLACTYGGVAATVNLRVEWGNVTRDARGNRCQSAVRKLAVRLG